MANSFSLYYLLLGTAPGIFMREMKRVVTKFFDKSERANFKGRGKFHPSEEQENPGSCMHCPVANISKIIYSCDRQI